MTTMSPAPASRWREPSILPGFGLSLGYAIFYLTAIIIVPLAALALQPWTLGWDGFWAAIDTPRVLASLELSFGSAAIAAAVNSIFGLIVAWSLVRYRFPFRRLLDSLVDLPFAIPTAVAGIALSALYGPHGWLGRPLADLGIRVAYTRLGILVALIFIGLPFVVRTVEPIIAELRRDTEEAAATLGANRLQTFVRVTLRTLAPALLTGAGLAFARGVGEYGSVIFIAGNIPLRSEIAPLLIVTKLEQYDYAGASALGLIMLAGSFLIILALNKIQTFGSARQ